MPGQLGLVGREPADLRQRDLTGRLGTRRFGGRGSAPGERSSGAVRPAARTRLASPRTSGVER